MYSLNIYVISPNERVFFDDSIIFRQFQTFRKEKGSFRQYVLDATYALQRWLKWESNS